MAANAQDRRVRRTRRQLQQALAELMREKDIKDITVRELTERADVNRGTFYAHYKDLCDMLEQVEQELFRQLSDVLTAHDRQELRGDLIPVLEDVFTFVWDNRDMCLTMFSQQRGERFFRYLRSLIYEKYLREWNGLYDLGSGAGFNYYLEFVVSGTMGLVRAWIENDLAQPPQEMAALCGQLIVSGLPSLSGPSATNRTNF